MKSRLWTIPVHPEADAVDVMSGIAITSLKATHYSACKKIYQEGLDTGIASFETKAPDWQTWDQKFLPVCRRVALIRQKEVGWFALTAVSQREVYKGVAEVSLYVDPHYRRNGIGDALMTDALLQTVAAGFWMLQASIFTKNTASLRLFKKHGFRLVGIREKIAKRDEIWCDTFLVEKRFPIKKFEIKP